MWDDGETVSVVFPAYNEAANITQAVRDFLSVAAIDEVLVVDNNSRDGTGDLARAAGARVVVETKQGYGNALQRGLREATGDYIVLAEPDGTFVAKDVVQTASPTPTKSWTWSWAPAPPTELNLLVSQHGLVPARRELGHHQAAPNPV